MIFLCGISCCPLFVKKDMALPKLLCVSGHSPLSQVFGEYAAYFILMFSNILVILVTVFFALGDTVSIIPELYDYTALDAALLVIKFIPGIIMITSLQYLLYEISSSIVSGVLLQFISSIALTYAGGCFYPISFFPEGIQKLAKFLPSGIARSYLSECITSEQTASAGAIIILVSVLFIGLAVVVRKYRITQK